MKVKEQLSSLQPYKPGKSAQQMKEIYGDHSFVKLASNENPFGCSPRVIEELQKAWHEHALYPDGGAVELRQTIAEKLQVQKEQIICGSGLDEVIQIISRAVLCKGDNVVTAGGTFPQYRHHAVIEGCEVKEVPLQNGSYDLEGIAEAIDEKTKIIWICNPNNPTGTYIDDRKLNEFINSVHDSALIVIDEAYYEYVTAKDFPETIPLLKKHKNLLILRTFSKAYGLASFRVGYAIGQEELIEKLNVVRLPFNVSLPAQRVATIACNDEGFIKEVVRVNREGLERYESFCNENEISFYPSQTNFIFLPVDDAGEIYERCAHAGFIIRPFPNGVRITIGTSEQNEGVISVLKQHFINRKNEFRDEANV
ncbi:histidinol-phosphate transaminase [Bacillus pseudomycoides]|uniref:histidinol-phosphate transaminase n=1 Tax=Bacillus pseudomycoides TaxID=64104 RepID=UPI000BECBDDA|nr:histidinol-phosphate transaminase [Bacillus pseudomycoides]PEE40972.1 histidinol-phosphate transaminase [Bacillus pseudomycoides]PGA88535.1 histidinol-phosphate transaminase [Bacillus pseudomycoides]PHF44569.1 histidinol-phosphate transaminase [Bacillus pseudomycoides]